MTLIRTVAPSVEPITLAELKLQARIDTTDEDALLAIAISAARSKAEGLLRRSLVTQTWQQIIDTFPTGDIELGMPPVQSITSIQYVDTAGSLQALAPAAYTLDAINGNGWALRTGAWPTAGDYANAVRVTFVTGYGASGTALPADIRAWLLLTAAYLYANREAIDLTGRQVEIPSRFVDSLLDPYRIWGM